LDGLIRCEFRLRTVAGPLCENRKTGSVWAEVGAASMSGPLDPGVRKAELDGARRVGERVARLALKLKRASADALRMRKYTRQGITCLPVASIVVGPQCAGPSGANWSENEEGWIAGTFEAAA